MKCRFFAGRPVRVMAWVFASSLAIFSVVLGYSTNSGASKTPQRVLLALGDSLAAGYQPFDGTTSPPVDVVTGYPDLGYPGSYAADIAKARGLRLVDLGCPGETTRSMLGHPAEATCASIYRHEFGASSQLAAAITYLTSHRGRVALLTLDIGSNDADQCISGSGVSYSCATRAGQSLLRHFETIVKALKSTLRTKDPGAPIVTMNYYDPFLGLSVNPGGASGMLHATESLIAVNALNVEIKAASKLFGLKLADVAGAFKINSALPLAAFAHARLPMNVATNCKLTWMCPQQGMASPNIHPNVVGYRKIASAFLQVVPKQL